ncbi:MAG: methyltransferase domain-containing protein [Oscillospiraceae bacterium]|nr:methyltransferase domain-containing protein [Oscillospiraceae bacterium]
MARLSPDITAELLSLLQGAERILDVGCGDASLLRELQSAGVGRDLRGIDPAFSGGTVLPHSGGITLLPGHAEALPFEDASFDAVILQCVFSLCRPEETAREARRVLKPGGRLILADLFAAVPAAETVFENSPLLSRLDTRERLEAFFLPGFRLAAFRDLSPALKEMIIEAIWAGEEKFCASCGDLTALRRAGARYGLWLWRKI